MLLTLHKLVQLICAPALNVNNVCYLNLCIHEYIAKRQFLFPDVPLRPKHHYITHYPYMILQYEPLSKLWALRFESKHRYFKRVIKSCGNFVNVTHTLAHFHQMLQSHLLETELFEEELQLRVLNCSQYSSHISSCIFYDQVSYKGTRYICGYYVVLERLGCDLLFGKIVAMLFYNSVVYLLVDKVFGDFVPHLNAFYLNIKVFSDYACVKIVDLYDFNPLQCYNIWGKNVVCLKHFVK